MMKEGQDDVHRAATPSILPYLPSGRSGGKNTTARVFSGSYSSLEMVGYDDVLYCSSASCRYKAALVVIHAWNTALGESSLE